MQLVDPTLALAAETVDDLERVRIGVENRLAVLTRSSEDKDGAVRGFKLPPDHPDVKRLQALLDALEGLEHDAILALQRKMRAHPLGPWIKSQVGIGEKQAARLLATIQDPYWNHASDRPRTVSALWAYCGLHTIDGLAAKRRRGELANWSSKAKMRTHLIAESCIKQMHSPYRKVYDLRRQHTAETHPDWTAGHSHNDALRIVSKEILKELWREAKRLHGVP